MPISSDKQNALYREMISLGILETDIEETFVRSSGAGGQHVNKTSSCVQLLHKPTGLLVKCQEDRSQAVNRFLARRILLDKFKALVLHEKTAAQQKLEKIRPSRSSEENSPVISPRHCCA